MSIPGAVLQQENRRKRERGIHIREGYGGQQRNMGAMLLRSPRAERRHPPSPRTKELDRQRGAGTMHSCQEKYSLSFTYYIQ